jgi:hypothetical protein
MFLWQLVMGNTPEFVIFETFEKYIFLFEFKEGENFNHRHTLSISRIKILA